MRILSLNAWGGLLYDRLVPWLVETDADVICLQEIVRTPKVDADWLEYRDGDMVLQQRPNLYDDLATALSGHAGFFCPASRGDLFDGETRHTSEFGLATFVRRSLPIVGQVLDFVHGEFSADGWGEHPRARNAHCVRLFDPGTGATVTVAHMHGLRDLRGKIDTPERAAQARAFAGLMGRIHRPGEPLVACGDFNVLPDSETLAVLARLGLSDLVTGRGFTDTRTSYYGKEGRFADYMLVTPQVNVGAFDVVADPEVSDHRALLLDLA